MEGQTLSHYKVLEKLGGGGMGVVYKALDTKLDRPVALKFLPPELTRDDDARTRFMQEARAASALDHPNICTIYEIDETPDGQLFIAMGFYDGETLKERIAKGPLPIDDALDIAVQMAQGLSKAHAAGIIHRDIKPANVMITADGLVKIVDFGIAKLLGATGPTQTGTTLGTVSYMSPEQVAGEDADQQSDVWSLGAVLYEMLTGEQPFKGESAWAVMNSISHQSPDALGVLRPDIPAEVERVVLKALAKSREDRIASTAELGSAAESCRAKPIQENVLRARPSDRRALAVPGLLAIGALLLGTGVFFLTSQGADERWMREEALPTIGQLIDEEDYFSAFELASEAERRAPGDSALAELWTELSNTTVVTTDPPGADIYIREYADIDGDWLPLGQTPTESIRIPKSAIRMSLRKDGFESAELAVNLVYLELHGNPNIELRAASPQASREAPVPVHPWGLRLSLTGYDWQQRFNYKPYTVDRYEVTNAEYQEFVEAGGYDNREFWKHEFTEGGRSIPWGDAMAMFRDSTGRAGPSTWEGGTYPPGHEHHPVSGVSWYEAAAYAAFRGKMLPTVYHWAGAAGTRMAESLATVANFAGTEPVAVGSRQAISPYGAHDMAGNVKEWCWNAAGDRRYILGGGWSDPAYAFTYPEARPPLDRAPMNGIRLAGYAVDDLDRVLVEPIPLPDRAWEREPPVSDEVFALYLSQYDYDPAPLDATVQVVEASSDFDYWDLERATFDAAYGGERVHAYLYLPKNVATPYQAVIVFPGTTAILTDSFDPVRELEFQQADWIVKSGRAVVFPIIQSTFERRNGQRETWPNDTRSFAEHVIQWVNDIRRTIDFLETREDIDTGRLAYYGTSWGGRMGAIIPAVEQRFAAAVLYSGALAPRAARPEANQVNFAPRVTVPVLMLNGRHDFYEPVETAQVPLFELFGTPESDKRHVVFEDAGHGPLPRVRVVREALAWLDKYLGPVN